MENIQHKNLSVNGINMHVAEIGEGPSTILFLHGFPELWYTWRHQLISLSSKGYRAIAPDLRGYGDTDSPPSPSSYTVFHIVGDLIALLDALGLDQVFLVGHDWGAVIAWHVCLLRPDRIKALVNMSVVFHPRNPKRKPIESMRAVLGDDYYICRFQEYGEAEEEFASVDTARLIAKFLTSRNPAPLRVPKEKGFGGSPHTPITLPSWLSEEDVNYYANKFRQSGFTGGLNYYRAMDLDGNQSGHRERWKIVPACIWWSIWMERNQRCFKNKSCSMHNLKLNCMALFFFWCKHEYPQDAEDIPSILEFL